MNNVVIYFYQVKNAEGGSDRKIHKRGVPLKNTYEWVCHNTNITTRVKLCIYTYWTNLLPDDKQKGHFQYYRCIIPSVSPICKGESGKEYVWCIQEKNTYSGGGSYEKILTGGISSNAPHHLTDFQWPDKWTCRWPWWFCWGLAGLRQIFPSHLRASNLAEGEQ